MASKQLILDMFACANRKDFEGLSALLADDYAMQVLPASLGVPPMNKERFLQGFTKMSTLFPNLKFHEPEEVIVANNTVIVHVQLNSMKASGSNDAGATYSNELIHIFRINGDGKVASLKEFMDAKAVGMLMQLNAGA
ncbi:hypothetical protein C8J57DRAFT_1334078 [Mycena rebaudengoi]|nr:hypothetical protein C8J57DRAFT_1334078 [Mycena rebaudengoi]